MFMFRHFRNPFKCTDGDDEENLFIDIIMKFVELILKFYQVNNGQKMLLKYSITFLLRMLQDHR